MFPEPTPARSVAAARGTPARRGCPFTDAGASPHDSLPNDPTACAGCPRRRRDAFRRAVAARSSFTEDRRPGDDGACSRRVRPPPRVPCPRGGCARVAADGRCRAARPAPEKDASGSRRRSRAVDVHAA
jgi:hypothetical protein